MLRPFIPSQYLDELIAIATNLLLCEFMARTCFAKTFVSKLCMHNGQV